MIKKLLPLALAVALCLTNFTAYAFSTYEDDDEKQELGFIEWGYVTDTTNEYFFETSQTLAVYNKEVENDPDYAYILTGSDIYVPVNVNVGGGAESRATDKLIKTDNVSVSWKVIQGTKHVGDVELIDGKKLKLDGIEAGMYARITLNNDYSSAMRDYVIIRLVLSVRDVTYQDTQVTLKFRVTNRRAEIYKNSIYGAKAPTLFKVRASYNGEATFDFGDNIKYTAKVKEKAMYYLNISREPDEAIKSMYPDAFLDFYNFIGERDTFESRGTLNIPVKRTNLAANDEGESLYVYRIDGSTLTSLGNGAVSYDSKAQMLTINTKTLQNYVLSNQPLKQEISEAGDDILKSGYAAVSTAGVTEIGEPAASSAGAGSQSQVQEDADGYVPEESAGSYTSGNINDNVETGGYINAANKSTDNPQTSDRAALTFAWTLAAGAALLATLLRKRAPKS